jgi:sec-independent protein translocase protein TatC
MASCLFLFLSGVLFSYFVIAPISMQFLANYSVSLNVSNTISLESYIGFITSLVFAGGILFEMPIFVYFLAKAGIITDKNMRQYRKHAIIVILFLSALITPPDIASQVILSLPLLVLYELSILIAKNISKENI